jgi:hypothetical protein
MTHYKSVDASTYQGLCEAVQLDEAGWLLWAVGKTLLFYYKVD